MLNLYQGMRHRLIKMLTHLGHLLLVNDWSLGFCLMPRSAPIAKVSATQGYGAEVVLAGNIYGEPFQKTIHKLLVFIRKQVEQHWTLC